MNSKSLQLINIIYTFRKYFALSKKSLNLCKKLLITIENKIDSFQPGSKRLCISLFVQTIRLFEAILILCHKGLDEEAKILTRSLIENTSYLLFILEKDHEDRAILYQHSRALSGFSSAKRLNDNAPNNEEKLNMEFLIRNKENAIAYFRKKYGINLTESDIRKKYALRPQNAAEKLEGTLKKIFLSTYGIFYSTASAVTHGEAPLNFMEFNNNKITLKKWSKGNTTKTCLQSGVLFTLCSLDDLLKLLEINHKNNISPLIDELFRLIENNQG